MSDNARQKKPRPTTQDVDDLVAAATQGDAKMITAFLKKFGGREADAKNAHGDTALTRAARFNQVAVVRRLLAAGAGVDVRDSHRGTALMDAAVGGNIDVIKELLAHGADVTKKSYAHKTALWYAEVNHHEEAARLIADVPRQRAEAAWQTVDSCTAGLEKPLAVSKPLRFAH